MTYTAEQLSFLASGTCVCPGVIFVDTAPTPTRMWTGLTDRRITGMSGIDTENSLYRGAGKICSLPTFQSLTNAIAERITFTLEGVTDEMVELTTDSIESIRDVTIKLALMPIESKRWAQVGDLIWVRDGIIDMVEISNEWVGDKRVRAIQFSCASANNDRSIPFGGTYTMQDQRARPGSEDDAFFDGTSLMAGTMTRRWP